MLKIKPISAEEAPNFLFRRLSDARAMRKQHEEQWRYNETLLYNALGEEVYDYKGPVTAELLQRVFKEDEGDEDTGVNYVFKHHRFLNAQMSANPPSVQASPTSSDPADKRRADSADRLCRHAIRAYAMQERIDLNNGQTLLYGTGFMKTWFDPNAGEIRRFDPETGELEMSGDFRVKPLTIWDVWIDPFARLWDEVEYVFERVWYSMEEALMLWPDSEKVLRQAQKVVRDETYLQEQAGIVDLQEVRIPVFLYYERGLPVNGMQGRHAAFVEQEKEAALLTPLGASPHKFYEPSNDPNETKRRVDAEALGEEIDHGPEVAVLPYHILTDIDVTDSPYGKSFIEYAAPGQDTINRLDSLKLENIAAHGYCRIILPEGADIAEDSIKDTPWEIIKVTGGSDPHFFEVPKLMPEVDQLRESHKEGVGDMAGINDSMYGKQEREQSGFSMQYATNQGNMIRRRIFNKYVLLVEGVYRQYLAIIQKHWKDDRTIKVLGREKSYQLYDIKGADILGGFDLVVEYGSSLSLDPTSRREEIMALMPLFEKAGVESRSLMNMLKLNELSGMHDLQGLAKARQQEIFEKIIAGEGDIYIPPREMSDHKHMLIECNEFVMTAQFRDLPPKIQKLIEKHIQERVSLSQGKSPESAGPEQGAPMEPMAPPTEMGGLETPQQGAGQPLPATPAPIQLA